MTEIIWLNVLIVGLIAADFKLSSPRFFASCTQASE